jgi:hypothetical protein
LFQTMGPTHLPWSRVVATRYALGNVNSNFENNGSEGEKYRFEGADWLGGDSGRVERDRDSEGSATTSCTTILNRECILPKTGVAILGDVNAEERGDCLAGEDWVFMSAKNIGRWGRRLAFIDAR